MATHVAFIKEKIMASKSRFFQASFSTALLRSAVLAIALVVPASPTLAAEPVTLSCRGDAGSETYTLRINYATGLVEQIAPNGTAYTNRVATADISPNAIVWYPNPTTVNWSGQIDRLSGTGSIQWTGGMQHNINITCREATKPKF